MSSKEMLYLEDALGHEKFLKTQCQQAMDALTDPELKSRDRIVKKTEKDGLYTALDVGCVWLERALAK